MSAAVKVNGAMSNNKEKYLMESRTGRDNQRYGPAGERLVAGVVPLSSDKKKVMLIQSARRGGWVLPKGGWELDETAPEAACREAWEEAGVVCRVEKDLGHIADRRPPSALTKHAPTAAYQFFEAIVMEEKKEWPEMKKRGRKWASYKEAADALTSRPELLEALQRSSIVRETPTSMAQKIVQKR